LPDRVLRLERGPLARRRRAPVLALGGLARHDDGAGVLLLLELRRARARGRRPDPADVLGWARRRLVRHPVPALLALHERTHGVVDDGDAVLLLPPRSRRLELRRGPHRAPLLRARGRDALARRALPAVLALPRRR